MKRFPFYPLCVAAFALLSVFASNTGESSVLELLTPLAVVSAITLALLGLATLAMRNVHRAAILVGAFVFLFLTYGFWVDSLWAIHPDSRYRVVYHRAVLIVQALLLIYLGYVVVRRLKEPQSITPKLNRFGLILLACPILVVATRWTASSVFSRPPAPPASDQSLLIAPLNPAADRPDIYFIVLDAHGRQDILREQYQYDDSPFLQHLREKGFYIAEQSTSNYMWTELSVPACLNMRYLNDLPGDQTARTVEAQNLIHNNALIAELKTLGYRTVAFEALEPWLCLRNADLYFDISAHVGFTPLQQLMLDTSALSQFGGESIKSHLVLDQYHLKREMMLFKLAKAPQAAALPGPKFVFLHIMEPHTPFVFKADGSDPAGRGYGSMLDGPNDQLTVEQYRDWYHRQAIFTDNQAAIMIDGILARSRKPPVIVMIGDHGPRSDINAEPDADILRECLSNLTAVYLPGKGAQGLYPQITPVNLFRVVLNDYFDAKLPMLEDKSYYSYPSQFPLRDVTGIVKPSVSVR